MYKDYHSRDMWYIIGFLNYGNLIKVPAITATQLEVSCAVLGPRTPLGKEQNGSHTAPLWPLAVYLDL